MIQEPSYLTSEVFKQKYFSNFELMETKIGTNLSFVWKILLADRQLLEAVYCGGLVMVEMLKFGRIHGSPLTRTIKSPPLYFFWVNKPLFYSSSIMINKIGTSLYFNCCFLQMRLSALKPSFFALLR